MTKTPLPIRREELYNLFADFAVQVVDLHKRGLEPTCEHQIKQITIMLGAEYETGLRKGHELVIENLRDRLKDFFPKRRIK